MDSEGAKERAENIVCCIATGHFEIGAISLLNSLVRRGFTGIVVLGVNKTGRLEKILSSHRRAVSFVFKEIPNDRHPHFQKAFLLKAVIEDFPDAARYFLFDADMILMCRWSFLEEWVDGGVAIVKDIHFGNISKSHPWRRRWRDLILNANLTVQEYPEWPYANSGFLGLKREQSRLVEIWCELCLTYERCGGSIMKVSQEYRPDAFCGDQDILACALMTYDGPLSVIGPEAMGFTRYLFIFSHGIENPKPWRGSLLLRAIKGEPPSSYAKQFLSHANGSYIILTKWERWLRTADLILARLVSRIWRRP